MDRKTKFYTFKRGSVIMVNFTPQVGSEIRGKHFAVVLTKHDRFNNELLTVIPLTSKFHRYHLDLGDEIKKSIYERIIFNLQIVITDYCNTYENKDLEEFQEIQSNLELCNQVSACYQTLKEHTYAKPHQITTISKYRIVKPVNKYDPIRSLNVSNKVMDKIDRSIIELFTKIDID